VTSVAGILGHGNYFAGQVPKAFSGDWSQWNAHKYRVQQEFKRNRIQELVATKSFGMGIDKPNIRYTIHYTVPQSVEAFYQEAGRAGRNGFPGYALCSIIYSDDNWDAALEILNEPNHPAALARLEKIGWDDRGDLLVQLWLLFNSYRGRNEEKKNALEFWNKKLAPVINGMPVGATNTQEIPFGSGNQTRVNSERAIFRLMLLGVVQDYTINWHQRLFAVRVQRITPTEVKDRLRHYLMQYKFEDFAQNSVRSIPEDSVENALRAAINVLIDFIYDDIVVKRKQALRTMGELCRNFINDQEFREAILAYLQESEFSDELREWVNRSFEAIGIDSIHDLLERVTTLEEVKRLVGTTRRMLDEDPQNIALRYLSICARAQSAAESDTSVLQETTILALQVDRQREDLPSANDILLSLLNDIATRRPALLASVGNIVLGRAGTATLARMVMQSDLADDTLYSSCLKLLAANALHAAMDSNFYTNLRKELYHA
jgi:ATP-dependent DNA helicase RecQ